MFFVAANAMNITAKFQLYHPYVSWGVTFSNIFRKFSHLVAMFGRGPLNKHFWKTCQNICSEIAIKAYFHFSHYKSMENLSFHSNKSTLAMAIKNIVLVMNISAKLPLHPPYGFWGDEFWIFFPEFSLSVAMATNQIQQFEQNSYIW